MPRTADKHLEKRILDAGYKLWSEGGEAALTMRDVAVAAGTTTPTVYERFRDKDALIRSLQLRARSKMLSAVQAAPSSGEFCRRALGFMLTHGHEYLLLTYDWGVQMQRREPMPAFQLLQKTLARELGGAPEEQLSLAIALTSLMYGTASLLHAGGVSRKLHSQARRACIAACDSLIHGASRNGFRARRG